MIRAPVPEGDIFQTRRAILRVQTVEYSASGSTIDSLGWLYFPSRVVASVLTVSILIDVGLIFREMQSGVVGAIRVHTSQ